MKKLRTFHSSRAFTMIEVVIAMGLISVALASILALFPLALNTARDSQAETRSTQLAQNTLVDLVTRSSVRTTTGWQTNLFRTVPVLLTNRFSSEGILVSSGGFYQQRVTIFPVAQQVASTNWQVQVYTAWPSLTQPVGSNTFCRIVSRP